MYAGEEEEYLNEDDRMDVGEEEEYFNEDDEITQEDAWAVISANFEAQGLVRQQLDSFDQFIQNTIQEIVDESSTIEIKVESQHNPGRQIDFTEVINYQNQLSIAFHVLHFTEVIYWTDLTHSHSTHTLNPDCTP